MQNLMLSEMDVQQSHQWRYGGVRYGVVRSGIHIHSEVLEVSQYPENDKDEQRSSETHTRVRVYTVLDAYVHAYARAHRHGSSGPILRIPLRAYARA